MAGGGDGQEEMLGRGLERQGLEEKEVPPGLMGGLRPVPAADTNVFNLTSILLSDFTHQAAEPRASLAGTHSEWGLGLGLGSSEQAAGTGRLL